MSIISVTFFAFLIVSLLLYYVLPLRIRWVVLLLASGYFVVMNCSPKALPALLIMTLGAYAMGLLICLQSKRAGLAETPELQAKFQKRKSILTGLAIVLELTALIIYKDIGFFITNGTLLGFTWNVSMPDIIAPLGISYYTLILVGYLLDVSWETSTAQRNPAKFLLFGCFFPQMVSGPITRYRDMAGHLYEGHKFDFKNLSFGAERMLWGIFKKLVIAERIGIIVNTIYSNYETYSGLYVLIAVICYTLYVYADFSGYMDIVIGASEMFGIVLPENFRTPFYSTNLSEVWRRWHMTLGFWVKDYLLYPTLKSRGMQYIGRKMKEKLGKSFAKKIPTYLGMFVTWFAVGFWHGGSWKFIFGSGLFFFLMIVGGMLLEPVFGSIIKRLHINTDCFSWRLFQRIRTFMLFAASVSFGRASLLSKGFEMWQSMFRTWNPWIFVDSSLYGLGLDSKDFTVMLIGLGLILIISMLQQRGSVRQMLSEQNLIFKWIVILSLIFSILIFGKYGPGYNAADFIYGGF